VEFILNRIDYIKFMFDREIVWIFPSIFIFSFGFFHILLSAQKSPEGVLKKWLYVPARKSVTNAVQLGGLPMASGFYIGFLAFFFHPHFESFFTREDYYSIKYWLFCSPIIIFYGYLDDKYELRPMAKLLMQLMSVLIFAILESRLLLPQWSSLALVVISFWGLGAVNGSNLLDGLDTLTIKLDTVTMGVYMVLGWYLKAASVLQGSLLGLTAMTAFYYFNKEPARIHLGEIGGSFLGLISLLLSCFVFSKARSLDYTSIDSMALAVFPLSLFMVELGVSFLRRLYNKKSPFKGDKFHIHHLLRNYYKLSPTKASTYFSLSYFVVMVLGLSISLFIGPVWSAFGSVFCLISIYMVIGRKHWNGAETIDLKPTSLFNYLRKKDVPLISSMDVDEFEIHFLSEDDAPYDKSESNEVDDSDEDDEFKKAA
jgi:UDP-GlcNAc:undecaprenyl-phosphate/decaprenyl-phosphate GlcNAc-1-phosphate transferase